MFNKDIFRLYQCDKFPIVNIVEALCTVQCINFTKPGCHYPHSVVAHLLSLSANSVYVPDLKNLVLDSIERGWRPYRDDVSHYEKLCINKIVAIIDNYEKKNN